LTDYQLFLKKELYLFIFFPKRPKSKKSHSK